MHCRISSFFFFFFLLFFLYKAHTARLRDLRLSSTSVMAWKRSCYLSSGIKWRHAPPSRFHASQTSAICEHNLRANCDFMARQLRMLLPRDLRDPHDRVWFWTCQRSEKERRPVIREALVRWRQPLMKLHGTKLISQRDFPSVSSK